MGSTRLPGKILRPIGNRLLLEHVLHRLSFLAHPATVVVATTEAARDNVVAEFCERTNVACFRGSENDVLARYYHCARRWRFDQIVRLTADNPFTDIEELDRLLDLHAATNSDFSHSFTTLPVGVGAEVFSYDALEASFLEGHATYHREHVDEFLLENGARFKTSVLAAPAAKNRPDVRLTVDTEEDLRRACFIVEYAASDPINTIEAIELCSRCA